MLTMRFWLIGALVATAALAAAMFYQERSASSTTIAAAMLAQTDANPPSSDAQPVSTAEAGRPARLNVELPRDAADTDALSLVLGVGAYKPSEKSADAAVVSLKLPEQPDPIVLGRFSVFPRQSFDATQEAMRFSLRVQKTVRDLLRTGLSKGGVISVELVDSQTGKVADDASMTITDVKIVGR